MKLFLGIFTALTLLIAMPVYAADNKTDDIIVKVNGMVCDFCAQSLKKSFQQRRECQ